MDSSDIPTGASVSHVTRQKPVKRVSQACAQCRSSHLKCDGTTPICLRCKKDGKICTYLRSRRGGKTKAGASKRRQDGRKLIGDTRTRTVSSSPSHLRAPPSEWTSFLADLGPDFNFDEPESIFMTATKNIDSVVEQLELDNSSCQYMKQYYQFFHDAHPCVLPHHYLEQRTRSHGDLLQPLFLVMEFIGSIFSPKPSDTFREKAREILTRPGLRQHGFTVQAMLLLSVAIYWSDEVEDAHSFLEEAIEMALGLGMHLRTFAEQHGENDPVLEESWRRTWWLLFIIDVNMAASSHRSRHIASSLLMTTDLPCEGHEYHSGV